MENRYEFGSPLWLLETCKVAERCIVDSGADLTGIDYTFGEELVGMPARLNPSGAHSVGWTVRVHDGKVTTAAQPPTEQADLINVADWETVEPLCHWTVGENAQLDERMVQVLERLGAEGKFVRIERNARPGVLEEALAPLHNSVVAITGPRQTA